MLVYLGAGFESAATVLTWFIYLMSKHPRVQQKIKAEMRSNDDKQNWSLERLDSLIYLDCVIKEVLRFSPVTVASARTLTADDCLSESGVQLYKGDHVLTPTL